MLKKGGDPVLRRFTGNLIKNSSCLLYNKQLINNNMQEQKTNSEKIVNSSINEIRQKMLTICENEYNSELNFNSAVGFIGQIKEPISDLGCQVAKGCFESGDVEIGYIELGGKRYLNKGKSTKEIATLSCTVVLSIRRRKVPGCWKKAVS